METFNTEEYTKDGDNMMWELHNIRKEMAEKGINIEEINKSGRILAESLGFKIKKVINDIKYVKDVKAP